MVFSAESVQYPKQIQEQSNNVSIEEGCSHEIVIQLHLIFPVSHYQLGVNYQVEGVQT